MVRWQKMGSERWHRTFPAGGKVALIDYRTGMDGGVRP